jgi:hypothetical protein
MYTEKLDVSQGKAFQSDFVQILLLTRKIITVSWSFNSLLGGGIHSKLFQNVREKESLAYYAFPGWRSFKGGGLMMISCGIEINQKDKAQRSDSKTGGGYQTGIIYRIMNMIPAS